MYEGLGFRCNRMTLRPMLAMLVGNPSLPMQKHYLGRCVVARP